MTAPVNPKKKWELFQHDFEQPDLLLVSPEGQEFILSSRKFGVKESAAFVLLLAAANKQLDAEVT